MSERLYVTFTTKPLHIASLEGLPAVEASVLLADLDNARLIDLVQEADKRLEAGDAAD